LSHRLLAHSSQQRQEAVKWRIGESVSRRKTHRAQRAEFGICNSQFDAGVVGMLDVRGAGGRPKTLPLLLALILLLGLPRWISPYDIGMIRIGPVGVHLEGNIVTNSNMDVRWERHTHLPGAPFIIEVKPAAGVKIHIGRRIIPVVMLRPMPMGRRPRWGPFLIGRGAGGRGRRIAYDDSASCTPQYHSKHAYQQGSYERLSCLHKISSTKLRYVTGFF
jgi:hypothetical protein